MYQGDTFNITMGYFPRSQAFLQTDLMHLPFQNLQGLTGTPLVAGSPIRHDNTVQGNPVEVQTYQPPWKALSEFALQSDLDQPAFQQLVRDIPALSDTTLEKRACYEFT